MATLTDFACAVGTDIKNLNTCAGTKLSCSGGYLSGNICRDAHSSGYFVGGYNNIGASNTKTNPIFTIGGHYLPGDNDLCNMYGIGYSHCNANYDGISTVLHNGWGMYVAAAGCARIGLNATAGVGCAVGCWKAPTVCADLRLASVCGAIDNLCVNCACINYTTIDCASINHLTANTCVSGTITAEYVCATNTLCSSDMVVGDTFRANYAMTVGRFSNDDTTHSATITFKSTKCVDSADDICHAGTLTYDENGGFHLSSTLQSTTFIGDCLSISGTTCLYSDVSMNNNLCVASKVNIQDTLTTASSKVSSYAGGNGAPAIALCNSDINGINALVFNDPSNVTHEGILVPTKDSPTQLADYSNLTARTDGQWYVAPKANGTAYKVWTQGNMGPGSGLDADKIDGIDSSQLVYGDNSTGTRCNDNFDTITKSGFYNAQNATGSPYDTQWTWLVHHEHSNDNGYGFQMAVCNAATARLAIRTKMDGSVKPWREVAFLDSDISGDTTGNAATATKLATARTIGLSGDVSGSASFDGSSDVTIIATVANDSHTHDTRYYTKTCTDSKYGAKSGSLDQFADFADGDNHWHTAGRDLKVNNKRAMVGFSSTDGNKLVINYDDDFSNGTCICKKLNTGCVYAGLLQATSVCSTSTARVGYHSNNNSTHCGAVDFRSTLCVDGADDICKTARIHLQTDNTLCISNDTWAPKFTACDIVTTRYVCAPYVKGTTWVCSPTVCATSKVSTPTLSVGTVSEGFSVGSVTKTSDTTIRIKSDDGHQASLMVYGDIQGTGRVYVGQSPTYGGGIEYNGDNNPVTTGAGADYVTMFRRNSGTDYWTARNKYDGNDWEFRENAIARQCLVAGYHSNDNTSHAGSLVLRTTCCVADADDVCRTAKIQLWNNNCVYIDHGIVTGGSVKACGIICSCNADGNVCIGAQNTTWAHLMTDRPSFYTNKSLSVNGSICVHSGLACIGASGTILAKTCMITPMLCGWTGGVVGRFSNDNTTHAATLTFRSAKCVDSANDTCYSGYLNFTENGYFQLSDHLYGQDFHGGLFSGTCLSINGVACVYNDIRTSSKVYANSGICVSSGTITTAPGKNSSYAGGGGAPAIALCNSEINGINALVFNDVSNGPGEGILVPKTDNPSGLANYTSLYARCDGQWHIAPTACSTSYKIFHQGNMGPGSGLDADTVDGVEANSLARAAFRTDNSGTDSTTWYKIARVTLSGRYQNYNTELHYMSEGSSNVMPYVGKLNLRVKQQADFGNDPYVSVYDYYDVASVTDFSYVIVDNSGPSIVDIYVKNKLTYNYIIGTRIESSSGADKVEYYDLATKLTTEPAGLVPAVKQHVGRSYVQTCGDTMTGQLSVCGSGTIGGPNGSVNNGYIRVTCGGATLGIDPNEIQTTESVLGLSTAGGTGTLKFNDHTVWHVGNMGSGHGLDADKVDGLHASQFVRSDAEDHATGKLWLDGGAVINSHVCWTNTKNIVLNANADNAEWSFDLHKCGYTGAKWHVWDEDKSSLLSVHPDDGTVCTHYNLRVGSALTVGGSAGHFFNDGNGRTAYTGADFYIQSGAPVTYIYSPNIYLGDSAGSTVWMRGNALVGNNWEFKTSGELLIHSSTPTIRLKDVDSTGSNNAIKFQTGASQDLAIRHEISDSNLPTPGQAVVIQNTSDAGNHTQLIVDEDVYVHGGSGTDVSGAVRVLHLGDCDDFETAYNAAKA